MENMNKPKNLGNKCVTCRKYVKKFLDINLECSVCQSVYDSKMRYNNRHPASTNKEMPPLNELLDFLKKFGIYKTAERFNTTDYSLTNHLKKFDIDIKQYSKKPRSTFKDVLSKISDDDLRKELAAIGITKMRKKYGGDMYKLKDYILKRIRKEEN